MRNQSGEREAANEQLDWQEQKQEKKEQQLRQTSSWFERNLFAGSQLESPKKLRRQQQRHQLTCTLNTRSLLFKVNAHLCCQRVAGKRKETRQLGSYNFSSASGDESDIVRGVSDIVAERGVRSCNNNRKSWPQRQERKKLLQINKLQQQQLKQLEPIQIQVKANQRRETAAELEAVAVAVTTSSLKLTTRQLIIPIDSRQTHH